MEILGISNVIALLSGVALFLFGMCLMGEGLKMVAGNKLEIILYRLSSTPLRGLLLGMGVTAVIQSSSATSVMVVGFVNSGMMKVRQAIGIVMGAIVGTSVTGWIICLSYLGGGSGWVELFSTTTLTGIIAVSGIVLRMFCRDQTKNHIGNIFLGFAVLMFGMQAMSGAVAPLKESESFVRLLTAFSNPLLGILVGIIFTSILQSCSAAVGILQALSVTGAIQFSAALPMIMGIAIGAAVPVLLSALGANADGKRTALVYLVVEMTGVIIWAAIFYIANAIVGFSFLTLVMTPVSIALVNTLFRLVEMVTLMPFVDVIEALVTALVPGSAAQKAAMEDTLSLEERFVQHPALAIEQSRIAVENMARAAQDNLQTAFSLLTAFSDAGFRCVAEKEETVDRYEDALGTYLVKITRQELSEKQSEDVSKFLHTISDFERISDHAVNFSEVAREISKKGIAFSEEAVRELGTLRLAVAEIVRIAVEAFVQNDLQEAARVEPLEELIDNLCDEMKLHHVDRLQKGTCTLLQGFVFNDLVTNFERVADHCSNIAVAMIELESDAFDTHEYLNSVKSMRSEAFDRYFEEYQEKFAI
ncbi:MAG: Na/Pi cotransporter family protein [Oscillospiraceae bacterium]|nr:Na/Pi cotransporter family protein [Oscillospiraceae bacterium]